MTDIIRITDLGAPVLTDIQRFARQYGNDHPVALDEGSVLAAARERTGLTEFGDDSFRDRMNLWLADINADSNRSGLGRRMVFDYCVRYASNRLRLVDLLERHPEIGDVEIAAPIIVIGLPRSGTTHLLNLLSADPRLQSLPLWESYEPVADPRELPDGRYARAEQEWQQMQMVAPYTAAMHPMDPDHIHEEIELQGADFAHYQPEWVSFAPRYREWYLGTDQTPHYAFLRTALQAISWQRGRSDRWVLKSPQHLEQIGPLLATFPDAMIVMTHRDPVSVVQSAATMMAYAARLQYERVDPTHHLRYWTERIELLLRSSVRDAHRLPPDRWIDVYFDEFMADDIATVRSILERSGLAWTEPVERAVRDRLASRSRGKHGQVVYDLRADFGADPTSVREPFDFYFERFPRVQVEVT